MHTAKCVCFSSRWSNTGIAAQQSERLVPEYIHYGRPRDYERYLLFGVVAHQQLSYYNRCATQLVGLPFVFQYSTERFPLAANAQITFQEIINTYIHALPAKVRAISCWDAEQNPAYMTLRDHQLTYILRDVHTELCRPQMVGESAEKTQVHPFYVDNIDIDFDYSFIRNATSSGNIQTLTFEF